LTRFQARLLLNGRSKGFRLGPYVIQDQLGQGGMGTVFLAAHATLRRQVALKVLTPPKDAADTRVAVERFIREARAAAALDHPNIVRIHDIAQQGHVYYIGLEYVDGVTLEQLLRTGGPITPSRAVGYIAQAAAGLQHADERGFVHRDIKPSNLILTKDQKTLKILDMGLARSFNSEEDKLTEQLDHGAVTGTADFISPEQSLGNTEIDIRADIYSLGATFFTLLAGRPPFQGNTTQKLAQHQMKQAPDLSELDLALPRELAAVVAKMLAKKPKDRYQTPAEVIAALAPWLGNSRTNLAAGAASDSATTDRRQPATGPAGAPAAPAPTSEGAGTGRRTTRRRKRPKAGPALPKKALWIGGGALGAVLALVCGVLVFGGSKKPEQTASAPAATGNPPGGPPAGGPPKLNPPPALRNQTPGPKPPTGPMGDHLYHADFLALQSASRSVSIGEKVFTQQLGPQNLPLGWAVNHHETTTAAEYLIGNAPGVQALGVRHVRGGRTEVLCRLDSVLPTPGIGETRVFRVTYQFEGTGLPNIGVKLDRDPYTKHVLEPLGRTYGTWQQAEFAFTRPNADPVVFICNLTPDPKAPGEPAGTVWIRALDVWTTRGAASAAPGAAHRFAEWKAGPVVYKPDLSAIPSFRVTKEGTKHRTGTPEQLPKGVRAWCWKSTATAEFRCESTDGSPALGLTNLTDQKSAQITFELERETDLRLTPGKAYRVTVEYSTRNDAAGDLTVQAPDVSFQSVLQIPLPGSDGKWKTASGEFVRRDGELVRLNLANFSVGEGNTLYVRSITVAELVKPDRE
jgi:hypothetical protein